MPATRAGPGWCAWRTWTGPARSQAPRTPSCAPSTPSVCTGTGTVIYQSARTAAYADALDRLTRPWPHLPLRLQPQRDRRRRTDAAREGPIYPGTCRRGLAPAAGPAHCACGSQPGRPPSWTASRAPRPRTSRDAVGDLCCAAPTASTPISSRWWWTTALAGDHRRGPRGRPDRLHPAPDPAPAGPRPAEPCLCPPTPGARSPGA